MDGKVRFELRPQDVPKHGTARLDTVLANRTSESRSFLRQQILSGQVRVNGVHARKAGRIVRPGDEIEGNWMVPCSPGHATAVAVDLDIVFEDGDLLVINKPQGVVVHPAPSHQGDTLVHYVLHHLEKRGCLAPEDERVGIVHRLDKGTSGLLLVAKNRATQEALSAQFKQRQVRKTYEAIVWGKMPHQGRFQSPIGRDRVNRRKMSSRTRHGREAITDWRVARVGALFTHVLLFPSTGRTHQLRVHLSEAGHPIVGDPLYGRGLTQTRRGQIGPEIARTIGEMTATLLHAAVLEFIHPSTGEKQLLRAPRPAPFEELLAFWI